MRKKPAGKARNRTPVRAIESRRIQMTPELYANVRYRYEHTAEGLNTMAADVGCTAETVRTIARRDGWVRYRPRPRDLSPAAKLAARIGETAARAANPTPIPSPQEPAPGRAQARPGWGGEESAARAGVLPPAESAASLPPPERGRSPADAERRRAGGGHLGVDACSALTPTPTLPLAGGGSGETGRGEESDGPPAVALTVAEMHRVVLTELATVKAMRARMRAEPQTPADAEKTARTLNSLMTILRQIRLQQAGAAAAAAAETNEKDAHDSDDDYDDLPADIDQFRHEFARRIRAFVASRTEGGGDAGGDAAPPAAAGGA